MQKSKNIFKRFFAFLKFKKKPGYKQEDIERYIKKIRRNAKQTKERRDEIEMVFLKLITVNFTASLGDIYSAAKLDRLQHVVGRINSFKSDRTKRVLKKKRNGNK